MRWGLVYIWATAVAGMFLLYVIWPIGVYILSIADWIFSALTSSGIPVDQSWIDLYNAWKPRFRDIIGYTSLFSFISLVIYIIVNSARKEPDYAPQY